MADKKKRVLHFKRPQAQPKSSEEERNETIDEELTAIQDEPLPLSLPVLAVRDVVIFDHMIVPLFIGREKSIKAVDEAMNRGRKLIVCAQKGDSEDPTPEDLYDIGSLAQIMRILKMPDSRIKILAQGKGRVKITKYVSTSPYLDARYQLLPENRTLLTNELSDVEALLRAAREQSERILTLRGMSNPDIIGVMQSVDDPGRLADLIIANLRVKISAAQDILETIDPIKRLEKVNVLLANEIDIATVQARIQGAAREGMDKAQKEFYLREQMKAIRHELGDDGEDLDDEISTLKANLKKAQLPKEAEKEAAKQLKRLSSMHGDSAEANVARAYLEWLCELPWKKLSKDQLDIKRAQTILDEDHCGLDKVKDRILEYLSVRKLNPNSKGSILCFVGPPGVGKTSLGKSIARAMGRKFQRISLGGMHDEAEIRGHRRTYIGSMPGRIIQSIKQAGTRNPIIMLDEIDKVGADFRGDPASALLEALDPEQNFAFSDHYLNVPFDLSKVLFICTANNMEPVPPALKDRMDVIPLSGYTSQEKVEIAQEHLLPKQIEDAGLAPQDVVIDNELMAQIIREYTREAGVRNLERTLGSICRKIARKRAEGYDKNISISAETVHKLLGSPKFIEDEKDEELEPGMALGLAWTPFGGEVLSVEANIIKGRGNLLLTGQLGDVMKESAQAALSYIRSRAEKFGIDPTFATRKDIHIHVPAGATPKDGPSAGITLTTALISALSGKKTRADICMTGEITLQGRVLPVGGIKEKILAAVARGISNVIIPYQNEKDLEDLPKEVLSKIKVHPVRHYDQVAPLAFGEALLTSEKSGKPEDVKAANRK